MAREVVRIEICRFVRTWDLPNLLVCFLTRAPKDPTLRPTRLLINRKMFVYVRRCAWARNNKRSARGIVSRLKEHMCSYRGRNFWPKSQKLAEVHAWYKCLRCSTQRLRHDWHHNTLLGARVFPGETQLNAKGNVEGDAKGNAEDNAEGDAKGNAADNAKGNSTGKVRRCM